MKKLTELDLQNALDECELIRFNTHGDWLAGMVRRLNKALEDANEKPLKILPAKPKNFMVKTGNAAEPEVPCKS